MFTHSPVNLRGRRTRTLVLSAARAPSVPLQTGVFHVWADVEMWIAVGTGSAASGDTLNTADLSSTTGYRVPAGAVVPVRITENGDMIYFIAAGAGNAFYHKVD